MTSEPGLKGGEVTPLFFIQAMLVNARAVSLYAPVELFAAIGFVVVLAGATNTPLAGKFIGLELFGSGEAVYEPPAVFSPTCDRADQASTQCSGSSWPRAISRSRLLTGTDNASPSVPRLERSGHEGGRKQGDRRKMKLIPVSLVFKYSVCLACA